MEPTQEQSQQMGLSLTKDFEKISQKLRTPTQFSKPNLNFCIVSEKHEENGLEKTYLEVGNAENKLESDGV